MKSGIIISPVNMEERKALGIRAGDTVRVWQKIEELKVGKAANKKETKVKQVRQQAFEGLVLTVKHGAEAGATFTVRKVASGVGVEKVFPLYTPTIEKIEIIKRAPQRRAKLYHIREKVAREVKRQMRKSVYLGIATGAGEAEPVPAEAASEETTEPKA